MAHPAMPTRPLAHPGNGRCNESMNIQAWLGEMPKQQFVEQYYHKLPYSRSGGGRQACPLGSWEMIGSIVGQDDADVMIVRQGEQYGGEQPRSLEAAQALSADGYTVLIRHAERQDSRLHELAASFQADFGGAVNLHIYATPANNYGFGWHYDAEEVFILQTTGRKEYSLRKNTVNPWPLIETLPEDMSYERERMPLVRCTLKAGDWLYIPAGYWHMGQAEEAAISLAIGMMAPAALDIYDYLRGRLLDSLLWRQRLPVGGESGFMSEDQLKQHYEQLLSMLARDLDRTLRDENFLQGFLTHLRTMGSPEPLMVSNYREEK